LEIVGQNVTIRDLAEQDLGDYHRWFFSETEWQKWDAPWEKNDEGAQLYIDGLFKRLQLGFPEPRTRFDIYVDSAHIGWVTCYFIAGNSDFLAVGIDIVESDFWGRGIDSEALNMWISYIFLTRKPEYLYCETWSGNERMIRLALKTGFEIIEEYIKVETDGQEYTKIKFRIHKSSQENISFPRPGALTRNSVY